MFKDYLFAKLQRERSCFGPGLFWEEGGGRDDPAGLCNPTACVTRRPVQPDGLCDQTACVLPVVLVTVLAVVLADVLVFKEGVKKHYVLCEKCSNTTVLGKGLRKTAARTLLFLSGAVLGGGRWTSRGGWPV